MRFQPIRKTRRAGRSRAYPRREGGGRVERTVPVAFTASETFDVGIDPGSPVSLDYFDKRPFAFNGTIKAANVDLKKD